MKPLLTNRTLLSYSLAHFSVDLCAGALPIIMLYLAPALQLSVAQAGLVLGVYTMSSSLSQPLFGYISDRLQSRWQSALGLAWLALFQGATGFAPNYGVLLLLAGLAGLGSGAFHPHGASGASRSGGAKKTSAMAVFMLGGNTGYALGPVVAAALLETFNVHGSGLISVIGLLLVPFVYAAGRKTTRDDGRETMDQPASSAVHRPSSLKLQLNPNFTKVAILALLSIMFFRAWTQAGITAFTPLYFNHILHYTGPEAARVAFQPIEPTIWASSVAWFHTAPPIRRITLKSRHISKPLFQAVHSSCGMPCTRSNANFRSFFIFSDEASDTALPKPLLVAPSIR